MNIANRGLSKCHVRSRAKVLARSEIYRLYATSVESIARCPDPMCACAAAPADLDIDRSSPLAGTVASYDEHVVIRTGTNDWSSRIEDDQRFPLVKMLKQRLGRGGKFHDPFTNNLVTTSSSTSTSPSILLFPSFRAISSLHATPAASEDNPTTYAEKVDNLVKGFLLAKTPSQIPKAQFAKAESGEAAPSPDPANSSQLLRDARAAEALSHDDVKHLTVLICGHNNRDSRCGILGPLLQTQFNHVLARKGWSPPASEASTSSANGARPDETRSAVVEMISHVGGHKFAGNVILYIPTAGRWKTHPLAGKGVWYGRVDPKHVEGIVEQTIEKGLIIRELFRGGTGKDKDLVRI